MSQRNSETDGMVMGMAFVGVAVALLAFVFYAVVCFAAIVLTLVLLTAWNEDRTIGTWTIKQEEARTFVYGGLIGMVGLSVFSIFCTALLQGRIPDQWWGYILLGGYSFGALGISAIVATEEQKKEATAFLTIENKADDASQPPARSLPAPDAKPFRFASWDDEENGR